MCTGTSFCSSCDTSGVCLSCVSGWVLSSTNVCEKCTGAPECAVCDSTNLSTCTSCLDGFYISDGSCIACPYENCKTCNATVCLSFKEFTFQQSYNNNPSAILYPVFCNPECASCSVNNPEFCYQCQLRYAL